METLLGAAPTDEDTARSPQILEAIRNTELNAQLYVYEMHQERRSNGTHLSYYVDYNGFTVKPEQVNSAYLYTLLPYKDTQRYGDYWAILRKRPGAAALTIPEYMPNKQYRYKEVLRDFERAGLTLSPSRQWTEVPLSQFKVEFLYPYFPYVMGNKVDIKKMNKDLNLHRIPYKSEQVMEEKTRVDRYGNTRSSGKDVNPTATMAMLLSLQVLPNDHKTTLDEFAQAGRSHGIPEGHAVKDPICNRPQGSHCSATPTFGLNQDHQAHHRAAPSLRPSGQQRPSRNHRGPEQGSPIRWPVTSR